MDGYPVRRQNHSDTGLVMTGITEHGALMLSA
jgi:hypothetical protein